MKIQDELPPPAPGLQRGRDHVQPAPLSHAPREAKVELQWAEWASHRTLACTKWGIETYREILKAAREKRKAERAAARAASGDGTEAADEQAERREAALEREEDEEHEEHEKRHPQQRLIETSVPAHVALAFDPGISESCG